jgi:hypothetical protein
VAAYDEAILNPKDWALLEVCRILDDLGDKERGEYIAYLCSPRPYGLNVEIRPESESELGRMWKMHQVPIEPIYYVFDQLMALTWIMHHEKLVVLKAGPRKLYFIDDSQGLLANQGVSENKMNLIGQALNAGVPFDVPLGFEFAGYPCPKSWENFRSPDGDECPLRANVTSRPTLGECVVHFHNGEYALVTGASGTQSDLVRVESLESTATGNLQGLVQSSKPNRTKEKELSDAEIKALAEKYA